MEEEIHSDSFKDPVSGVHIDGDEGPLLNENSNGLSHLLTEGEFNSVDAVMVDESSTSNQGFLNAVELSGGSVGDYLDNNDGFNAESFAVGDNAVTFPSDSLNHGLSDGDSHLSDSAFNTNAIDTESEMECQQPQISNDNELESEVSNDVSNIAQADESVEDSQQGAAFSEADVSMDAVTEEKALESDEAQTETLENHNMDEDEVSNAEKIVSQEELSQDKVVENHKVSETDVTNAEDVSQEEVPQEEPVKKKIVTAKTVADTAKTEVSDAAKTDVAESAKTEVADTAEPEAGGAEETEVVSEDELPTVEKPRVKDAENVSDDELPGPKPAELPADTEVVSEDELPSSKKDAKESRKRKNDKDEDKEKSNYDPSSPTSEESASKKQAIVKNGESKPIPAEKRPSTEEKQKKKVLPELDKYWKVVNDDPTDFTGWTYLLQYVDQESDVEAAREAYDAFLSHYPYCYGYWRKYADYEKRKGSKKKCLEVLERGLKAIPLSVDLWIHYLNHVKTTRADELPYIRSQYERAIETCGLEFRSDRLWEAYIKWETEHGLPLNVTSIYDRLLATPTLGYTSHFDNFQEHIQSGSVVAVITLTEVAKLRAEVREGGAGAGPAPPAADLPPGEDEPPHHIASEEEGQAIKERIISARRKIHKQTGEEVAARWTFEEGIKRPYFHVKPLERCQLKNWKAYLEWEKTNGSFQRALILHERCLIACALYEEFWMRLIKFLEERIETDPSLVALEREALERACLVHHLDKPALHLHWATFEEAHGNEARAAEVLERIEKTCPNLVQIHYRRINLERRRADYEKCIQLYESYITSAKSKSVASSLAIKYARFLFHVRRDPPAARKVLDEAIVKDPLNERLHLQRLDLAVHTPDTPFAELEELVLSYEKQDGSEAEVSAQFAWRRRELAEELGDARAAHKAAQHQRALSRHLRKRTRKHDPDPPSSAETKKKEPAPSTPAAAPPPTPGPSPYYGNQQSYEQQSQPQQQQQYPQPYQPNWGYQQPPAAYQHGGWPQYPNYY